MPNYIFDVNDPEFDRKSANLLILRIQKNPDNSNNKLKLFKMMKKIVVKNINNYLNLLRNSAVSEKGNNADEMQAEAYFVMDKCLENYKVSIENCFYFYFNKALSRKFYRIFQDEVRENDRSAEYAVNYKHIGSAIKNHDDYDISLLLAGVNLTEVDILVMNSKMNNENKDDFIKRVRKQKRIFISTSDYNNSIKKVKQEALKLRENGEL